MTRSKRRKTQRSTGAQLAHRTVLGDVELKVHGVARVVAIADQHAGGRHEVTLGRLVLHGGEGSHPGATGVLEPERAPLDAMPGLEVDIRVVEARQRAARPRVTGLHLDGRSSVSPTPQTIAHGQHAVDGAGHLPRGREVDRLRVGVHLRHDRAAQPAEQHQDDRPDQGQPQGSHDRAPFLVHGSVSPVARRGPGGQGVGRASSPPVHRV